MVSKLFLATAGIVFLVSTPACLNRKEHPMRKLTDLILILTLAALLVACQGNIKKVYDDIANNVKRVWSL